MFNEDTVPGLKKIERLGIRFNQFKKIQIERGSSITISLTKGTAGLVTKIGTTGEELIAIISKDNSVHLSRRNGNTYKICAYRDIELVILILED